MGFIEPLTITAAAVPSGILPLDSSLLLSVPLVSLLGIAAIGLWYALPRRQRPPRTLRLAQSTAV